MIWLVSAFGAGLVVVAGVWWLRRTLLVVTVHGPSMIPTYRDGDRLLVRRVRARQRADRLRAGQVVVADLPSLPMGRMPDPVTWDPAADEPMPGEPVPGEPVPDLPAGLDPFGAEAGPPVDVTIADSLPDSRVIKRLAAVAGDPVPPGVDGSQSTVPPGKLVLLGDNPSASIDSRNYGWVSADIVIGAVVRRLR